MLIQVVVDDQTYIVVELCEERARLDRLLNAWLNRRSFVVMHISTSESDALGASMWLPYRLLARLMVRADEAGG